ncbi:hypothetical protein NL676_034872 [Syzygium grande]|nr:hypothetical protein NL676_034872 [Syzygium grande]
MERGRDKGQSSPTFARGRGPHHPQLELGKGCTALPAAKQGLPTLSPPLGKGLHTPCRGKARGCVNLAISW